LRPDDVDRLRLRAVHACTSRCTRQETARPDPDDCTVTESPACAGFSWPGLAGADRVFPPRQGGGRWFEPSIVHPGGRRGFGGWRQRRALPWQASGQPDAALTGSCTACARVHARSPHSSTTGSPLRRAARRSPPRLRRGRGGPCGPGRALDLRWFT
jgi:hypothetical protein